MVAKDRSFCLVVDREGGFVGPLPNGEPRAYTQLANGWVFDTDVSASQIANGRSEWMSVQVEERQVRAALDVSALADVQEGYLALNERQRRRYLTLVVEAGFGERHAVLADIQD